MAPPERLQNTAISLIILPSVCGGPSNRGRAQATNGGTFEAGASISQESLGKLAGALEAAGARLLHRSRRVGVTVPERHD